MTATTASRTAVHHRRHRRSRPLAAFDAAMDSPAAARSAATDVEQASTLGVPSTPRSSRTGYPRWSATGEPIHRADPQNPRPVMTPQIGFLGAYWVGCRP